MSPFSSEPSLPDCSVNAPARQSAVDSFSYEFRDSMAELHRHGVAHLVRDDAEAGHVAVGAERVGRGLRHSGDEDVVVVDGVAARAILGVVRAE